MLLDTNALLWVLMGHKDLGARARSTIAGGASFSSVSVLEITIKTMLGKLAVPRDVAVDAPRAGLTELPFTARHAHRVSAVPELVRHDLFDRMLLAQAQAEGRPFMTADGVLLGLGLDWVIDAKV